MGGRTTAVPWFTRLKFHKYRLNSMPTSRATAAVFSVPRTMVTHQTSRLVHHMHCLDPFQLRISPYLVTNLSWRMYSTSNNSNNNDRKTNTIYHYLSKVVAATKELLKKISHHESQQAALNRGREFVVSIMKDIQEIPESNGMRVLPQIPTLDFIGWYDLVIRDVTQPFWEDCIREVSTADMNVRVCAVGTPGIGKTSSTPFLIRMLLKEKHTVVYRRLSSRYFWEFAWKNEEGGYVVTAYPRDYVIEDIESLNKSSTFYIVDPGSARRNCVPDSEFVARTIIVASPNESNWGGRDFTKQRFGAVGRFRYYPLWTLTEILKAKTYLSSTPPSDEEIQRRFRQVGGVLRHIFANNEDFAESLQSQKDAIEALTKRQAQLIFEGQWNAVASFGSDQPRSSLIGYSRLPGKMRFSPRHVTIISPSVAESITERFIGNFWNRMLQEDCAYSAIFENYCRILMARPAQLFRVRECCGTSDSEYKDESDLLLGGCTEIRMSLDIVAAVLKGNPMILYHSVDPKFPFIDFLYKDEKGEVHAFQPTVGKTHVCKAVGMDDLRKQVERRHLHIYYLTQGENFKEFVTNPRNPPKDELTKIWHVLIPNPNKEFRGSPPPL